MLKFRTTVTALALTAIAIAVMTMTGPAYAQSAAPAGSAATAVASAPVAVAISPEKAKLIQRVLELWHVENVGVVMLENPVSESLRQSRSLLQGRVSEQTQQVAMKDITQDAKTFFDDATPIVQASAKKLIPSTVVPLLAEKFSEEELRQIIAMLDSPVKNKFEAAAPEIEKALGQKIATDTGATINPKLQDLTKQIGERMRVAVTPP